VCDPTTGVNNCIKPNPDGSLSVNIGGGSTPSTVTIDQTTPGVTNGVAISAATGGVTDGSISTMGAKADSAWTSGSGSLVAILKALDRDILLGIVALGQTTKSASVPVTMASDQGAIGSVNLTAAATGGCTPYHLAGGTSGASVNANMIKSSAAGTLCTISAINTTTTLYYLRVYDTASGPTCSSATGAVHSFPIPPAASSGLAGGISIPLPPFGEAFANGIGYCVTANGTDTDNTNSASGIYINGSYK
jgi:hypothetical protein